MANGDPHLYDAYEVDEQVTRASQNSYDRGRRDMLPLLTDAALLELSARTLRGVGSFGYAVDDELRRRGLKVGY